MIVEVRMAGKPGEVGMPARFGEVGMAARRFGEVGVPGKSCGAGVAARRFCLCGLLGLLVAASLLVGGCAPAGSSAESSGEQAGSSSLVATSASSEGVSGVDSAGSASHDGMQMVTDSIGRTVEVPVACERIAALDSFAGEALVMAGAGPCMIAAPNGVSSDVILRMIYPELVDVAAPVSGGTLNIESLMSLKPDVALVKSSLYYAEGEIEKLEKLNIPYLVIEYESIDAQISALELIESILPEEQAGRMGKIVDEYRSALALVDSCAARIPESEKMRVYHSINQAVLTDGATSIGADWVERTGAVNVSSGEEATAERGDYQATLEQVFVWDPDVVICNEATTVDYLLSDSKWEGLRAVAEQRVYPIPIGATRWGQRGSVETWFAMMWLGKLVYPDYYSDIDLHGEVVAFYQDVLGVEVDDALYDQMISGRDMRKQPTGDGARN